MKKINRFFFQILTLAMILSSAFSNAFAQENNCINAYMVHPESCNPGHDGIATVFIPSALNGKCTIEWQVGNGDVSSDLVLSGLSEGTYPVTVKSTECPSVIFYSGAVEITRDEECKINVGISGPTYLEAKCNDLPTVTFIATVTGGVPPYHFHGGWTQTGDATATKEYHPSSGYFSISCSVSDSTAHQGYGELSGYAKVLDCAQDPNEIKGPEGYSEEKHFVNKTDKMSYTIDFENDPDFAMAPASRVKITYDVPDKQKLASFRLADFGFGDFVFTVPSNVSSYSQRLDVSDSLGVWVDVTAGIDIANNQLFWIFQSIDPATGAEPASSQMGFLSINDSLGHGQGYVSFYIAPDANIQTGDTVGAEALIVFDDNDPIGTNVWTNTFDAVAPTSTLYAEMNALDSLYCTFSFDAQDDPNGSGVRSVEVYMSVNNADYVSIGSVVPDSTISYALENGVYYQFMSIATDNVGNKEALKAQADTSVNYNTAPIDLVLNGNTFYEYDPMNTYIGTLFTLDNDVNLPFVYELVSGEGDDDNNLFTIEGNTLQTNATFICSRRTDYSVRIRTTDIGGLSFEKSFALNEVIQHVTPIRRLNKAICEGGSIDFNGRTLTEAGTYTDTLLTAEGCDSIVVWYLKVNPSYVVNLDTTVCDQFVWNDSTYTQSDLISYTYILATGCDSTVNYNLTVKHSTTGVDELVACDSLTWIDGITYYESTSTPTYTYVGGNAVGCDSIVTLNLTINHSTTGVDELVACDSLTWIDGITYYESTNIPTFTLTNAANCDSVVTLHLTVNYTAYGDTNVVVCDSYDWYEYEGLNESGDYAHRFSNPAGCDSVAVLHLTVNHSTTGVDELVACDSLTWINGITYYESTSTPTFMLTNAANCDSVVTLNLTINHSTTGVDELVACDSLTWINGITYYESTSSPTFTLTNAANCDSVVTLNLTINHSTTGVDELVVCDSLTWINGITYYESTSTPTYTLTNAANCDSVVTLHLTVNYTAYGDTNVVVCDSYDWYEYEGLNESGDYAHRFSNPAGCDSVAILHLTVNHSTTGIDELVACDSLTWIDGITYYESTTTPTFTLTNAANCDSVVTLNLTINHSTTGVDELVACDSLTWINGITYYESTSSPTFTLTNAANCDSVVTLNLTVNHSTIGIDELVACDSLTWINGITYYESTSTPTFTLTNAANCDSVVTLHLTVNYTAYGDTNVVVCDSYDWYEYEGLNESGDYSHRFSNPAGCDSVAVLHLTVNHSTTGVDELVACDSLTWINGTTYYESTSTPTYTYVAGNAAGCDSVVTLHLTINHSTTGIDEQVACDSLSWIDGITYYESTSTPTYTYVGGNAVGCDSVVTLHLTINHSTTGIDEQVACDSLTWIDGITYYESTSTPTYTYNGGNAAGCDSVVTLHLTVNHSTTGVDELVACDSLTWIDGITYYESTSTPTYTFAGGNAAGCDSVVTLHLTVNHSTTGVDELVACDSLTWIDGITYYESTSTPTYTYAGGNAAGCDSVVTLHLTVNHSTTGVDELVACDSLTWIDGITYYESTSTPTYTYTGGASFGCDSIVTLHLTINHGSHSVIDTAVCGSFVWNGETYTQSGTYTYEYSGTTGCVNTETLHLTLNPTYNVTDAETICASELPYTWNGVEFTQAGTQTVTLPTVAGCDSVVTMTLTVNPIYSESESRTICASELPYTWNGVTFTEAGTQTVTLSTVNGCDSVVAMTLTVNQPTTGIDEQEACDAFAWIDGTVYTESTNTPTFTLTNAAGCDSVVTLHLTIHESVTIDAYLTIHESDLPYTYGDTTFEPGTVQSGDYTFYFTTAYGCDSIIVLHLTVETGIDNYALTASMNVYPNPTTDKVNVQLTVGNESLSDGEIQLYDMYGKWLQTVKVTGKVTEIDLSSFAAGVYFVKAVEGQQLIGVRKIVKE